MKILTICCCLFALISIAVGGPIHSYGYGEAQQTSKTRITETANDISNFVGKIFLCISKLPRAENNEAVAENLLLDKLQTALQRVLDCVDSLKGNPSSLATTAVNKQEHIFNGRKRVLDYLFKTSKKYKIN